MKRVAMVACIFSTLMFSGFTIVDPALADKIKVGIVLPLTGKLAKFGEIENKSFLMAVDEINAAGGVNGKKIDLIIEDTMGKPDVGRSAIKKLISQRQCYCHRRRILKFGDLGDYCHCPEERKVPFLVNTAISRQDYGTGLEIYLQA